jgi:hypothetical protein
MFKELKGMEEVLHQREEKLSIQLAVVENAREIHHKNRKKLVAKEKKLWRKL